MWKNNEENVEENSVEFQEINTLEQKKYSIDMCHFWNVADSGSTVDINSILEDSNFDKNTNLVHPYVNTSSTLDLTPILINSHSVLNNKLNYPLVSSNSKMEITPNLIDTDVVLNNEIDFGQTKELSLSKQPELQENDDNKQLVSLLEEIEGIGREIVEIKEQLVQLIKNNQAFFEKVPLSDLSKIKIKIKIKIK